MLPGQTHRENISSILCTPSTSFYKARQARDFIRGSHSQVFYKKAVLKYFTKFTEKHTYRSLLLIKMQALITLQLYYEKILTQERNLTIFKHAILCSTPSTSFYKACQTQQFFEARQARKHAKHGST